MMFPWGYDSAETLARARQIAATPCEYIEGIGNAQIARYDSLYAACEGLPESGYSDNAEYGPWRSMETAAHGLRLGQPTPGQARDYAEALAHMDCDAIAGEMQEYSAKYQHRYADEGDEIDPDRMLAGSVTPWGTLSRGRPAPHIRIAYQGMLSAGNSANNYTAVACTTAAAAEILTRLGYSVSVVMVNTGLDSRTDGYLRGLVVEIKRASDYLDTGAIICAGTQASHQLLTFFHLSAMNGARERGPIDNRHYTGPIQGRRRSASLDSDKVRALCGADVFVQRSWAWGGGPDNTQRNMISGLRQIIGAAIAGSPVEVQ